MRYFGSKSSTLEAVVDLALDGMRIQTAADAFGGLGTIGAALRQRNVRVTTCDILSMPHAFQHARVVCSSVPRYLHVRRNLNLDSREAVLDHLVQQRNSRSWIVNEFARQRMFFTVENAIRIAGVWDEMCRWNENGWLSTSERAHLVSSFVDAMDACANTAGTYYAHLKHWDRKALRPFTLSFLPASSGFPPGQALRGDALETLRGRNFDLLYLDPPYNDRDYARYYHLPESLAQLNRPRTNPDSLAGLPKTIGVESAQFRQAMRLDYLQKLLGEVGWKRVVVQYCDDAFIPLPDLRACLSARGTMTEYEVNALGYTTTSRKRRSRHHVFIVDRPTGSPTKRPV
ncbi:DNA adenine methylase [Burkholderia gladioli]|uniref:DNA adenine methylase n=1 Tax=Burkholderia gladioli TaxID=28095 RepID=UPI001641E3C9|nr:DNA adenine methylase [Burkholderia gladioli]